MRRELKHEKALFVLCCLLQGCYSYEQLQQIDWQKKLMWTSYAVEEAAGECPIIAQGQLIPLVGKPDFKLEPLELRELLPDNDAYRARVMSELWDAYRQSKNEVKEMQGISNAGRWEDCEEFKKCSLWLYDESQRFRAPLEANFWHCWFCGGVGFTCDFFIVEGSHAIGAVGVIFWEPLRALRDRP